MKAYACFSHQQADDLSHSHVTNDVSVKADMPDYDLVQLHLSRDF